ncbi:MAG TPA: hypothetical protein VNZ86_16440 [Bacteroidia bacterium]|jgi:hypothetical protein|nr:hypothetical protein [Bacteroidia bacterium]
MKLIQTTLVCLLFISGGIRLSAQTADEIVDKYVKAIGGREKLNAVKTAKFTVKMNANGMDFPMVTYLKMPGSLRTETLFQGMLAVSVYDSKTKTGWNLNPIMGDTIPQKMNSEQTTEMEEYTEEMIASALVNYKASGSTLELIGKEDLEGVDVYKLMLTKKNKTVVYYSLDASSYLILKETTKTKFMDKEVEAETFYSNYKPFNGIQIACTTENKEGGQLQVQFSMDKVELDIPMDDALFSKPANASKKKSSGN